MENRARLEIPMKLAACSLCALWTSLFTCVAAPLLARPAQEKTMAADPMLKIRDTYLGLIAQTPDGDFRPLPRGPVLEDRAYFASLTWCGRVFKVPVNKPGDAVEHAYHVGRPEAPLDLFRHRLTASAITARIYEASSFFAVFTQANSANPNRAARASEIAAVFLALPSPATFERISGDTRWEAYSTDPGRSAARLGDWSRRIDAVVVGDEMALIVYKATFDDMMTLVSEPGAWFEQLRSAR